MTRAEVKQILQYPHLQIVEILLCLVNLKDKELNALKHVDIKGLTEDEAAEVLRVSKNSIQNWRRSAYVKCAKVWEENSLVKELLREV